MKTFHSSSELAVTAFLLPPHSTVGVLRLLSRSVPAFVSGAVLGAVPLCHGTTQIKNDRLIMILTIFYILLCYIQGDSKPLR